MRGDNPPGIEIAAVPIPGPDVAQDRCPKPRAAAWLAQIARTSNPESLSRPLAGQRVPPALVTKEVDSTRFSYLPFLHCPELLPLHAVLVCAHLAEDFLNLQAERAHPPLSPCLCCSGGCFASSWPHHPSTARPYPILTRKSQRGKTDYADGTPEREEAMKRHGHKVHAAGSLTRIFLCARYFIARDPTCLLYGLRSRKVRALVPEVVRTKFAATSSGRLPSQPADEALSKLEFRLLSILVLKQKPIPTREAGVPPQMRDLYPRCETNQESLFYFKCSPNGGVSKLSRAVFGVQLQKAFGNKRIFPHQINSYSIIKHGIATSKFPLTRLFDPRLVRGWDYSIMAAPGSHGFNSHGKWPFLLTGHLYSPKHAIVHTLANYVNAKIPYACCDPTELRAILMPSLDKRTRRKYSRNIRALLCRDVGVS
uniref:Autogenous vein graft remodeling associated protein 1 n=1 Tax=Rattus norvegicus TaxID=10116 RepID=Q2MCS9_RAT|nr:autogenous vein graft remodeling associated protein 1 [Rattus norvegicus]ABC88471.1 autogenous vein graft remodeling associated protein 1 [Rattus norvegicus]CAJ57810.1 autogenous vein graft remodelling associated protein 1, AVGR1 [Rattus norvegicus]